MYEISNLQNFNIRIFEIKKSKELRRLNYGTFFAAKQITNLLPIQMTKEDIDVFNLIRFIL